MKQLNITSLIVVLLSMIGLTASAHDIEVKNGDDVTIYYNFINDNTELEVTFRGSSHKSYSDRYTGNVVIPESVTYNSNTYSVTSIGIYAFFGCSELTYVTIGNSVTSIGGSAFYSCSGLTSVTIGNSVTNIGSSAFYGCKELTSVTIPNSVTSIGSAAFSASGLISVTIPNSVTSIGSIAFGECSDLASVTISNGVTSIGYKAFRECKALTSVTIPNSVTDIEKEAFSGCSNLTSVTIDSNSILSKTYSYINNNNISKIFGSQVKTYIIGNSVTSIGDYVFFGCSSLTSVTIPNSVTSIGQSAFSNCSSLTSITIPNSVTSINSRAFESCSKLTSISIPSSVTKIGSWAFYGCSKLNDVYNEAITPQILSSDPLFNYSTTTLHVPEGTKALYQAADYWKNFSNNIVDDIPTAINNVNGNVNLKVKSTFSIDGKSITQPQKGINIQKMSDGTSIKIVKN